MRIEIPLETNSNARQNHKFSQKTKKSKSLTGFTLLELLIVIAILAALTTVVVLVLNPAEYLAQARDSQRISDLNTLSGAIALFLTTADDPNLGTCATTVCTFTGNLPGGAVGCGTTSSSTLVSGAGWVAVDFTKTAGGSPISREPIDPTNNTTYKYAYKCDNTDKVFELNANMESQKFSSTGGKITDIESNGKDGGSNNDAFEIGTRLDLF